MKRLSLYSTPYLLFALISCKTSPTKHFNTEASLQNTSPLSEDPLLQHVITTSVNTREHTMSTLYGNDPAWQYSTMHNDSHYPQDAILYEVTWLQKEDTLWFGANIPKAITSVIKITFDTEAVPACAIYEGSSLTQSSGRLTNAAIQQIVDQRMAVSP